MMTWTKGNIWVKQFDCERSVPFQYKYVVVDYDSKEAKRWEKGRNRICDPQFLEPKTPTSKEFELEDEWEHFTVTFSLYYPLNSKNEFMRINGGTDKLGDWNKGEGPLAMTLGKERVWLTGEKVEPWEMARVRWRED